MSSRILAHGRVAFGAAACATECDALTALSVASGMDKAPFDLGRGVEAEVEFRQHECGGAYWEPPTLSSN